jgi:iron-sulfur cluster assembly protein
VLALTPNAAEAVDSIVSQPGLPENAGLRISMDRVEDDSGNPRTDLHLSVVEEPESGDELLEGFQIYVESGSTAEFLEDKLLDAEIAGNEIQFSLQQQA